MLLREAIEQYRHALQISEEVNTLTNLAVTQRLLGEYEEAFETYTQAKLLAIRDRSSIGVAVAAFMDAARLQTTFDLLNEWGLFLSEIGDNEQAIQRFQSALHVEYREEGLNNLGMALAATGKLDEAQSFYLEAENLVEGSAAYNLACLYAKRGDRTSAWKWLKAARDADQLPPLDEVRNDPDLVSLHDLDWFKDFTR